MLSLFSRRSRKFFPQFQTLWLLLLTLSLAGCSTFERDWRHELACGTPRDGLDGLWEGTWRSDFNGHHGGLRAIVRKQSDNCYHVHYKATFLGCIPYEYQVSMHAQQDGHVHHFQGEADLGWLAGGHYTYAGQADGREFLSGYNADKDYGVFMMRRPCNYGCCHGGAPAAAAPLPVEEHPSVDPPVPAPADEAQGASSAQATVETSTEARRAETATEIYNDGLSFGPGR